MGLRTTSIVDVIRRNAIARPDRTAFVFGDHRISYVDYLHRVERLAAALAALGITAGNRIAVLSENNPEFVDLLGAASWLGAILVPINWRLSADEIAYIVGDAAPKLVVADASHHEIFKSARPEFSGISHWIGAGFAAPPFVSLGDRLSAGTGAPPPCADDGAIVMVHTAAVSGRPRGALVSQAGLLANAMQAIHAWSISEEDVSYAPLPLFHIAGINLLLTCLCAGGASVVVPRFDAQDAVRLMSAERVTLFVEFAPMLDTLLDAAGDGKSLASLRVVTGLDMPETIIRFEAACPAARFFVGFGQTETSGYVTMAPFKERPGSAGRPLLLTSVAIVDESDHPAPHGEIGEIVVRGPGVFEGYWNCPDDTAATFRNGWHHTGDNGILDADGYLWYKGRNAAKELIKPGGENVYPAEVEAALKAHAAVTDAIVFGVPDKDWGEAIKAVCVLRAGAVVTADDISAFVASRIARYKRPKHLVLAQDLPRLNDGRIDRAKTRTLLS
ncbi:MAG: AMP-binding protein [Bradyrhizobium sp.]|uniref:AMP-binding protein n=1 Tax=Bradyrhizobium sp. TaxID=376 RepID=UPI001E16BA65|nr:AMP-binding protein [Bradyrhizobium sp.]MBV9560247.1 AMP-binding protein [Bradyrhizobium sp.]